VEQQQGGGITDNMILSVIGACVRRSSIKYATISDENNPNVVGGGDDNRSPGRHSGSMRTLTVEERRRPLDAASRILLKLRITATMTMMIVALFVVVPQQIVLMTMFAVASYPREQNNDNDDDDDDDDDDKCCTNSGKCRLYCQA
jgi:hypothetical protein